MRKAKEVGSRKVLREEVLGKVAKGRSRLNGRSKRIKIWSEKDCGRGK